jgi:hypothetical protein
MEPLIHTKYLRCGTLLSRSTFECVFLLGHHGACRFIVDGLLVDNKRRPVLRDQQPLPRSPRPAPVPIDWDHQRALHAAAVGRILCATHEDRLHAAEMARTTPNTKMDSEELTGDGRRADGA